MLELKVRFVVATRHNRSDFFNKTATGRTLGVYQFPSIELDLYESNAQGLSTVYNRSIEKARANPALLVFTHDDVHISDFFWMDQLINALKHFDIVGVAGNKRRLANQPSWAFIDDNFNWDKPENLSGVVGHGNGFPPSNLSAFGPPFQEVKLLDGVFLACQSEYLINKDLHFDERFDFHFYDMDFCRQAEQKGARMGTWGISLIHESGGNFNSPQWLVAKEKYFSKWGN